MATKVTVKKICQCKSSAVKNSDMLSFWTASGPEECKLVLYHNYSDEDGIDLFQLEFESIYSDTKVGLFAHKDIKSIHQDAWRMYAISEKDGTVVMSDLIELCKSDIASKIKDWITVMEDHGVKFISVSGFEWDLRLFYKSFIENAEMLKDDQVLEIFRPQ